LGSILRALSRGAVTSGLLAAFTFRLHSALADEPAAPIPWAYGAYFGTGVYQTVNGETSYVLRVTPSWRLREASLDEQGTRTIGWRIRLPTAFGLHEFEASAPGAALSFGNVGTITAVPGVEIDVPMTERWSLKPLAALGWGTELGGGAHAWVYWAGVKSRVKFSADGFDWAIVNSLAYSGYTDNQHATSRVLPLLTGFEFDRPTSKKLGGDPVHLYWHLGYTDFLANEPLLLGSFVSTVDVHDEWEVGMAFGRGAEPLRLWRLRWDRVGIAYRFSSDHQFEGITLFFSSLFDR
jgi:hypothetical protein